MSDNINIKKGIFQGDSLSLLLFFISLIPLSLELNSLGYGHNIRTEQITIYFIWMIWSYTQKMNLKGFCE